MFRDGLFENPLGPPELLDLFLPLHKVHVGINFFKHIAALPLCPLPPAPGSPLTSGPLYRRIPHKSSRAKDAAPPESARKGPESSHGKPWVLLFPFAEDSLRKPALCSLFARDSPQLPSFPANLLRLPGPPSVRPCPRSVQPCPYSVRSLLLHSQSLSERST